MTEQQMIDYLRENGYEVYSKEEDEERENDFFHLSEDYKQNVIAKCKLRKELKEIKGKFESGQAVILPCKVGDIVYVLFDPFFVADVFKMEVRAILIDRKHILVEGLNEENHERYSIVSDYIFPTKEAAEAKLKELRGE